MRIRISTAAILLLLALAAGCAAPVPAPASTRTPVPSPMPSGGLRLTIKPARATYRIFDPMTIGLILENGSTRAVTVNARLHLSDPTMSASERAITLALRGPDGAEIPFRRFVNLSRSRYEDFVTLEPGQRLEREYDLYSGLAIMRAGVYHVTARYENQDDGSPFGLSAWTGMLESNELDIEIGESAPVPATAYIAFNLRQPPFDDIAVRQAFALAVDRKAIADTRGSEVQAAVTFTPAAVWQKGIPGKVGLDHDPAKAKRTLEKAGYTAGNLKGIQIIASENAKATAQMLVRQWKESLGVEVGMLTPAWSDYQELLRNRQLPQIYLLSWRADYLQGLTPYNFLTDVFYSGSPNNHAGFANSTYDDLVTQAPLAGDASKTQEKYLSAERILCETEVVVVPLYYYTEVLK